VSFIIGNEVEEGELSWVDEPKERRARRRRHLLASQGSSPAKDVRNRCRRRDARTRKGRGIMVV
jgi:hypothetical protein